MSNQKGAEQTIRVPVISFIFHYDIGVYGYEKWGGLPG